MISLSTWLNNASLNREYGYDAVAAAALFGAVFLVYGATIGYGFVWDDRYLIVENPYIRDLRYVADYFVSSVYQASYDMKVYRPLRQVVYALWYNLFELSPAPYHLLNIFLHALNVVLVLLLLSLLGVDRYARLIGASMMAVHPVHSEVVANITGLTDLLCLFFLLLTLIVRIRANMLGRPTGLLILELLLLLLALLSKEMAITYIALAWLIDRCLPDSNIDKKRLVAGYATIALISVLYVVMRYNAVGEVGRGDYHADSVYVTLLSQLGVLQDYLQLILFPVNLSARYDIQLIETWNNPVVIVAGILLLSLPVIGYFLWPRNRLLVIGTGWFFISLLPVMNILPIRGVMMAERYLYIPFLGMLIILGSVEISRYRNYLKISFLSLSLVIVVAYASITHGRLPVWANDTILFEDTVVKAPDSLVVRWNLFEIYNNRGDEALARQQYRHMQRINKETADGYITLAKKYLEAGRRDKARNMAEKALRTMPGNQAAKDLLTRISEGER